MIPLVIHQMWLDRSTDTNASPPAKYDTAAYHQSVKTLNPDCQHVFWNIHTVRLLFQKHVELQPFQSFWETGMRTHIERCDFARYALLWAHGGLYIDLDFTCLRPLSPLLQNRSMLLTLDVVNHNGHAWQMLGKNDMSVFNGVMGCAPRNDLWLQFLTSIFYRYERTRRVMDNTGPAALGLFLKRSGCHVADRPDWFVSNTLLLPKAADLVTGEPYLSTDWHDGSNWNMNATEGLINVEHYLQREHHGTILMLVLLVALVISVGVNIFLLNKSKRTEVATRHSVPPVKRRDAPSRLLI